MLNEIYALKADYEAEMSHVKVKLEVVNDLINRFTARSEEEATFCDTELEHTDEESATEECEAD